MDFLLLKNRHSWFQEAWKNTGEYSTPSNMLVVKDFALSLSLRLQRRAIESQRVR